MTPIPRHRRLYLKIWLTVIGALLLMVPLAWFAHRLVSDGMVPQHVQMFAELLANDLPSGDQDRRAELERLAAKYKIHLNVWDTDGTLLAKVGPDLPRPEADDDDAEVFRQDGHTGVRIRLSDGRVLAGIPYDSPRRKWKTFLAMLMALFVAIGLAALPITKRLTRRLEALQSAVIHLGEGELSARVKVEGRDEVGALATAFNTSASRIERLVNAQKRTLASASHELRSPLARLRMAIELLADSGDENSLLDNARRDVELLDELVEDVLIAARLEGGQAPLRLESLDLLGLSSEVAINFDCEVSGSSVEVLGDHSLLSKLIRNLLENAARYGQPPVALTVSQTSDAAIVTVMDRGPGIPPADAARIFEPFYRPHDHAEGRDGGVGLGLSLVADIAGRHHGSVEYQPRDGGGSVFTVRLPRTPAA